MLVNLIFDLGLLREEIGRLNFWELDFKDFNKNSPPMTNNSLTTTPSWLHEKNSEITSIIEQFISENYDLTKHFINKVPFKTHNYLNIIQVQMCLSVIKERIMKYYYRSQQVFIHLKIIKNL
jgi:hypothetical protein